MLSPNIVTIYKISLLFLNFSRINHTLFMIYHTFISSRYFFGEYPHVFLKEYEKYC